MHPRQAASFLLVACVLWLPGCVTRGPLLESPDRVVELEATPFFPQSKHECGPAALATVLGASRVTATPAELEKRVYLPGRRGSLQVEMQAAPRAYGRLSYRIAPHLDAIANELEAGRPVLVLHNYGLPFWPRWHYAVVVGFDGPRDRLLLRSGTTRRQVMSARMFMRAWDNGGRWALVILEPGQLPANPDRQRYLESAAAFEGVGTPADTWRAFDAAARAWPDEPVALLGRGTASYRLGRQPDALTDYRAALALDAKQDGARNNLAVILLESGCRTRAREELARIDLSRAGERLKAEVLDTQRQIDAATGPDVPGCEAR